MNRTTKNIFAIVAALVTIIGLVTGKFLFIAVWLPLGFLFRSKQEK